MAYGFGSALGAGASDRLVSALTDDSLGKSWFCRVYRNGLGGNSFGRIWSKPSSVGGSDQVHLAISSSTLLELIQGYDTTINKWTFPLPAVGAYHDILCAGDLSTATAYVWVDGVPQTLTHSGPAGVILAAGKPYYVGNRDDGARNWDGIITDFAVWNAVLTQQEASQLMHDSPANVMPEALIEYLPEWENYRSLRQTNPVPIGTRQWAYPSAIGAPINFTLHSSTGSSSYTITPSGGTTLSGAATKSYGYTLAPSGGVTLSGTATKSYEHKFAPSGGIALAGSATESYGHTFAPSGGMALSGVAAKSYGYTLAPSEGLALSGHAVESIGLTIKPVGGLTLAGAAGISFTSGIAVKSKYGGHKMLTNIGSFMSV